jgi:hypothetical protein
MFPKFYFAVLFPAGSEVILKSKGDPFWVDTVDDL